MWVWVGGIQPWRPAVADVIVNVGYNLPERPQRAPTDDYKSEFDPS